VVGKPDKHDGIFFSIIIITTNKISMMNILSDVLEIIKVINTN
jgi:hypothetical protein